MDLPWLAAMWQICVYWTCLCSILLSASKRPTNRLMACLPWLTAATSTSVASGCFALRSTGIPLSCCPITTAAPLRDPTRPKSSASRWGSRFFRSKGNFPGLAYCLAQARNGVCRRRSLFVFRVQEKFRRLAEVIAKLLYSILKILATIWQR